MSKAQSVKDVSAEEFIKAYSAHLKSNDKVRACAIDVKIKAKSRNNS